MNIQQINALTAALKKIGTDYLEAHPEPTKHWFLSGCHSLFYAHRNQPIAKVLKELPANMSKQELLNKMSDLYTEVTRSAYLLPEVHTCLCSHIPELSTRTDRAKEKLEYANPAGGEYTNWGLEIPHYQELMRGYANDQTPIVQKTVTSASHLTKTFSNVTVHTDEKTTHTGEIPSKSTMQEFLSSCYALFCTFNYQKVNMNGIELNSYKGGSCTDSKPK